ncbi:MAG: D-alanyl-D-alanine carboxypeptidase family protein [Pseudomonadales bacterium]
MNVTEQLLRLGITARHIEHCKMPLTDEACTLVDAGFDVFDRPLQMTEDTLTAWQAISKAAQDAGIELQIVSGFRSVDYQCELIARKLKAGQRIDNILKVNAIPGYSEHHTGRALDLTTPDCPPLETEFENTAAFAWLQKHAEHFNFRLSYPRDNPAGIDYEPWHWAYQDQ